MNKVLYIILISLFSLTVISCSSSSDGDSSTTSTTSDDTTTDDTTTITSETLTESEFSSEELDSAVETLSIRYSITVISDDNSEVEINSDADLTSYSKSYGKAKIKFPIEITVDGETILIEDHKELKALIVRKKKGHRHTSFKLVYPISVNTAKGVLEIADRDAMKTYKQSLEKGVRPEFVFPISVTVGEVKIEVNSKEALKKLFQKRKRGGRK
jgi:viroplasmin and RNaseH domain-containing protein